MIRGNSYDVGSGSTVGKVVSPNPGSMKPSPAPITTAVYVPATQSAKTVSSNTVEAPVSLYGDYEKIMQQIADVSKANTAFNVQQAADYNRWQRETNKIAMDFNAAEAAKNRDWQQIMSNTAHQREVNDLLAAGLNPVLSASGGNGAAVTSGATASGVTSSGTKPEMDTGTLVSLLNFLSNTMGYALSTATAGINAGATFAAAKYGADSNYLVHQDFPSTESALLASVLRELTGSDKPFLAGINTARDKLGSLLPDVEGYANALDNKLSEKLDSTQVGRVINTIAGLFKGTWQEYKDAKAAKASGRFSISNGKY